MDETDKKIIELLQQDGRLEDVEIAGKSGFHTIRLSEEGINSKIQVTLKSRPISILLSSDIQVSNMIIAIEIDLKVKAGNIFALLGSNGLDKTTLYSSNNSQSKYPIFHIL